MILPYFAKNCMKLKKICAMRGRTPGAPPKPVLTQLNYYTDAPSVTTPKCKSWVHSLNTTSYLLIGKLSTDGEVERNMICHYSMKLNKEAIFHSL